MDLSSRMGSMNVCSANMLNAIDAMCPRLLAISSHEKLPMKDDIEVLHPLDLQALLTNKFTQVLCLYNCSINT